MAKPATVGPLAMPWESGHPEDLAPLLIGAVVGAIIGATIMETWRRQRGR